VYFSFSWKSLFYSLQRLMPDLSVQVGTVRSVAILGRELQRVLGMADSLSAVHMHTCTVFTVCMCDGHKKRIKYQDKENKTKTLKRDKLRNMTEKGKNKNTEKK